MNKKSKVLVLVSLLITLTVIVSGLAAAASGSGANASAASTPASTKSSTSGTKNFLDQGGNTRGASVPGGVNTTGITVTKIGGGQLGGVGTQMVGQAVVLEARDSSGAFTRPNIRTYVFFNLSDRLLKAWNDGELKVVYRPLSKFSMTTSRGTSAATSTTKVNLSLAGTSWSTCAAFVPGSTGTTSTSSTTTTTTKSGSAVYCLAPEYNAVYALIAPGFKHSLHVPAGTNKSQPVSTSSSGSTTGGATGGTTGGAGGSAATATPAATTAAPAATTPAATATTAAPAASATPTP